MNNLILSIYFLLFSLAVSSQVEDYVAPPDFMGKDVRVSVTDLNGQDETYKFKLTIDNSSSTDYYVYDINKTGYDIEGLGVYYPNAKKNIIIVPPGQRKSKVISLAIGSKPPVKKFGLKLEGLSSGKIEGSGAFPAINVTAEKPSKTQAEDITIQLTKIQQKKGEFSIQGEIALDAISDAEYILIYDPSKVEATDGGNSLMVEASSDKKSEIGETTDEKLKLSVTSEAASISLNMNKALNKVKLGNVEVPTFEITNGDVIHTVKTCDPYSSDAEGSIKINVSSEVGCFKFYLMGLELNSDNTSNLTFHMNPSSKKVKIIMDNGSIIEKSIWAKVDYKALYYTIKEKDGEYNLKYMPGSSEHADDSKPAKGEE